MSDHYSLLGLTKDASPEEIAGALDSFRNKMTRFAPGVSMRDEDIKNSFPDIWMAYTVLSDGTSRTNYDAAFLQNNPDTEPAPGEEQPRSSILNTFLSYATAIALMVGIVLFLAF